MTGSRVQDQPPPVAATPARSRRTIVAAALGVLVLLLAGGGYWHWAHSATVLFPFSGRTTESAPVPVGTIFYVGSDIQPDARAGHLRLTVRHVRPHLTENTAGATMQVLTCRVRNPNLGVGTGTDTSPCATVATFHPGLIDLGLPATEIVYRITATRAGRLTIAGADVGYSHGWREGDQRAGAGITLRVPT